jgi:hypothetical protein
MGSLSLFLDNRGSLFPPLLFFISRSFPSSTVSSQNPNRLSQIAIEWIGGHRAFFRCLSSNIKNCSITGTVCALCSSRLPAVLWVVCACKGCFGRELTHFQKWGIRSFRWPIVDHSRCSRSSPLWDVCCVERCARHTGAYGQIT